MELSTASSSLFQGPHRLVPMSGSAEDRQLEIPRKGVVYPIVVVILYLRQCRLEVPLVVWYPQCLKWREMDQGPLLTSTHVGDVSCHPYVLPQPFRLLLDTRYALQALEVRLAGNLRVIGFYVNARYDRMTSAHKYPD